MRLALIRLNREVRNTGIVHDLLRHVGHVQAGMFALGFGLGFIAMCAAYFVWRAV
jgi:hypothetical protein